MSDDCGCCTTPAPASLEQIVNRPGLAALAYRRGTFSTFRKALTDALSHTPELEGLTARVSGDYAITAIELWSAVADVLTFYQERIVNEAFLGTATLRDSVLRLVRLIDYELRPGAAATADLAFTLDVGATALIPVGTRVQSVPAAGEKAQKFETLAPLAGDARLNRLRLFPAPARARTADAGSTGGFAAPDAEALAAAATLSAGDHVMLYSIDATEVLTVRDAVVRDDQLALRWKLPISGTDFSGLFDAYDPMYSARKLGRSFHLFGFDAPATVVVPEQKVSGDPTSTYLTTANTNFSLHGEGSTGTQLSLDARIKDLKAGAILLAAARGTGGLTVIPLTVTAVAERHVQRMATTTTSLATRVVAQSGTVTQVDLAALGNAPLSLLSKWDSIVNGRRLVPLPGGYVIDWDPADGSWRLWYYDPTNTADIFGEFPSAQGTWPWIDVRHTLISMGDGNVLDWTAADGSYRLLQFDPSLANDIFASTAVQQGTWLTVGPGHQLIPLSNGMVLDWMESDGSWRLWNYDATDPDVLVGPPPASSTGGSITVGNQLIPMDDGYVIQWTVNTGNWTLWNIDPTFYPPDFPGFWIASGTWPTVRAGHSLIPMPDGRVLDLDAIDDSWHLWNYDSTRWNLFPSMAAQGSAGDIRDVVLYELLGDPIRLWPYSSADTVASSDVFLPGSRAGWSSVEVGRSIAKGAYTPGTVVDTRDFALGRAVLLIDGKGGAPIATTVAGTTLLAASVAFGPTSTDIKTIALLGLDAEHAAPITVITSEPLTAPLVFSASTCAFTITIGSLPTQTIALDPGSIASGALSDVATAMQAAIRATLPGAPTFRLAIVWVIWNRIAVSAGVPGDRIAFGPAASDADTITVIGLDPPRARYLDGALTGPFGLVASGTATGSIRITFGIDAPFDLPVSAVALDAPAVAAFFTSAAGLNTKITEERRVILLPDLPANEPRAFIRLALDLDAPLALDAATAVLLGNVAPASHGETVHNEIVGDGDASQAFQTFTLKKKPATYVPAATPGGVASSLQLLVGGVKWTEVPSLYGAHPHDPVFVTRMADDGTRTLEFGDDHTGARLPTGRKNLVATYRQGLGIAGRVKAGKLSTLLDRPTGVKGAINPADADGGADPEDMGHAREAAPGTVRTFGRAISLRDFEDTALLAGEVAKASATWVWTGERRAIHLTIAAQGGALFSVEGLHRLAATLATERDPNHKLLVDNYAQVAVVVDAMLVVDPRYVASDVLAAARAALLTALSFDVRQFAQPVYLSDVYRVLQDVPGVVGVDVNTLDLKSSDAAVRAAHGIDPTLGALQSRLIMLPARPAGALFAVLPAELAIVEVPDEDVTLTSTGGLSQ